jgi:hypothetical protein
VNVGHSCESARYKFALYSRSATLAYFAGSVIPKFKALNCDIAHLVKHDELAVAFARRQAASIYDGRSPGWLLKVMEP